MQQVLYFLATALIAYRVQRIVTTDDWPPTEAVRMWVHDRFGHDSGWFKFISCPHCAGTWITWAVYAAADLALRHWTGHGLLLPIGQALAGSGLVSVIADHEPA